MPHSYTQLCTSSWKAIYQETLKQSNPEKLTALVHASEDEIVRRYHELVNSTDSRQERSEMAEASAVLLDIKIHKLGWPSF
ncbi:MAG: hypothetical protein WB630_08185 [Candidatus Acidiferrales bacterium]